MLRQERERGCAPPQTKHAGRVAARTGGRHEGSFHDPRPAPCMNGLCMTRLVPVWSDDRRCFQGWEVAS